MKVVIVGGVAGGASTAARLRRLDENAEIIMFEKSGYISYANCGLPYYIGGIIEDKNELTVQTPESFNKRFKIDVRVHHEVIGIDRDSKKVTVKNLTNGEVFEENYDKLVLSTGAKPVKPPIDGIDSPEIFSLRTVEDTFAIYDYIKDKSPKSVLVVGGGFIGIEAAENMKHRGLEVTIAEAANQVLTILDPDMASGVHSHLRKKGINLMTGSGVASFEKKGERIITTLSNGQNIQTDFVVLAIGVTPDTALAANAGLKQGIKGAISVNDRMETSDPHIYAVGDAVEITHYITGEKSLISLAGPANKQGRIAADNICGIDSKYTGTQGSSVIKIFDMTAASTGINEAAAKRAGIDYDKVVISPASHASYYPGGTVMTLKILFEKNTERILGAQIIGFDGVDKRMDVIATAIRAGLKASELAQLELCYAPPYSSAKDPVNMAGFVIENVTSGKVSQFHYEDIENLIKDKGAVLLDTRTTKEYAHGHTEGFINIPVDELRDRLDEIPKGKPVYVMCQSGLRSYIACRILTLNGYECSNFSGGYRFYEMVHDDMLKREAAYSCGMSKKVD